MLGSILGTDNLTSTGYTLAEGAVNGAFDATKKQLGEIDLAGQLSEGVTKVATDLFTGIMANMTTGAELGKQFGSKFVEFAQSAFQSTGFSGGGAGSGLGSGINDFLQSAIKDVNLKGISGDMMGEVSDAFKEGTTRADMSGNMDHFFSELSRAFKQGIDSADISGNMNHAASEFDEGMGIFRENAFSQFDALRSDVQGLFSNMARDMTLKTIPWIALGGAVLVGVPMLTMYLYKRAVYNIGRPSLAQEVRKVSLLQRGKDRIIDAVSMIWDSSVTGIIWSTIAGITSLNLTLASLIASGILTGRPGYGGEMLDGLVCILDGHYRCNPIPAYPLIGVTMGAGLLMGGSKFARKAYAYVQKEIKAARDPKPIFSTKLQERIDTLATATKNISRNGGYLQNLLLYGPGGTGKTMISKYIAKNSGLNYVMMSGGDLAQYIKRGEHVTELNKLFADAKSSSTPTILFIDECESLCGDRGKMDRSELIELVNGFLNQTGEPSKEVMVILTTNRKDDLDPAVLSRMDHKLYIGPPQVSERKKIIELFLPTFITKKEREIFFTEERVAEIARQTEGFTGRTLFKMLNTMSSRRAATQNNTLTNKIIMSTVADFVEQEAEVVRIEEV